MPLCGSHEKKRSTHSIPATNGSEQIDSIFSRSIMQWVFGIDATIHRGGRHKPIALVITQCAAVPWASAITGGPPRI